MHIRRHLCTALLLLAACVPAVKPGFVSHSTLTVREEKAGAGEIAFSIRDGKRIVTDTKPTHTKEMHFIVVRRDLEYFQHLHPERGADGIWRTPVIVPAGGTYWFYADFADSQGRPQTLRFEKEMAGPGTDGNVVTHLGDPVKDSDGYDAAEKIVDGYRVQVSTHMSADGISFNYTVLDDKGRPVVFEDYLGEKGHSVNISPEGDFVHTHPFKEYVGYKPTDRPIFYVGYPRDSSYRAFTQFQIKGKVLTVDFDWTVPDRPSDTDASEEQKQTGEGHGHEEGNDAGVDAGSVRMDVAE